MATLPKKLRIALLLFVGACVAGLAFFVTAPAASNSTPVTNEVSTEQATVLTVNAGLPVRLKIPKINVDAAIDSVGTTTSGDMEAPNGPRTVGWYKNSPYPGDTGNAVIAGHYGRWPNGEGSVFDNLHKLSQGDLLYVEDEKGVTVTFTVQTMRTYDHDELAQEVFVPKGGKAHLNLITCQGAWNAAEQTYTKRLVVFADRVANP